MTTKVTVTPIEIRYVPGDKVAEVYMKAQLQDASAYIDPAEMELQDMPGLDHSRRPANHPKNLETIYRHYQTIDNTADERTKQLKLRSMTVGDAIVINGTAYYVAPDGFVTVVNGEIRPVQEPS